MKKLLLTLFIPLISISQVEIKNDLYKVIYSELYQQPLSIKYKYPNPFIFKSNQLKLKVDKVDYAAVAEIDSSTQSQVIPKMKKMIINGYYLDKNGRITTKNISDENEKEIIIEYPKTTSIKIDTIIKKTKTKKFKVPNGILTSDDKDYVKPYDKGHLVPKKSFPDPKYNDYLYSFLNCAIMHKALNRGVWMNLEKKEREISKSAVLKVNILVSFGKNNIVAAGASIPDYFTKILEYRTFDENENEIYVREVYTFPNDSSVKGKKLEDYKVKSLSI